MHKHTSLFLLIFLSGKALACANHFGTSVPHIYDEKSFLNAVAKQEGEIKTLTLEEMLNGAAAASPDTEKKNKFMEYYKNNVLHKNEK